MNLEVLKLMAEAALVRRRVKGLVMINNRLGDRADFKSLMLRLDIIEALIKCSKKQERINIRLKEIIDERNARG